MSFGAYRKTEDYDPFQETESKTIKRGISTIYANHPKTSVFRAKGRKLNAAP